MIAEANAMKLGERLRELRESQGLSLEALARQCDLSSGVIWRIEKGRVPDPNWSTIRKLARGLAVPVSELETDEWPEERPKPKPRRKKD